MAVLVLSPRSPGDRLRAAAAGSARALAAHLEASVQGTASAADHDACQAAKHELLNAFDSTPYRPTGLATPDQALANVVELLEWCAELITDTLDGHVDLTRAAPADLDLLRSSAGLLTDIAAVLSGDGMVSALRLAPGRVSFAVRYVETARHRAEVSAGRALFGKYRNPFTDRPEAAGLDRTVANTTPVWHAGRLLMTKEDGRPYRVDPRTLATLGRYDFGGRLKSATVTAHVRIDPETAELFFFGYEADGLASTRVAYCIADARGNLTREQSFDAPYCAMMHDFTVTERYALFPIYPTTCDLTRLQAGGDHWVHELGRDSFVGVMPRYGAVSDMRWFRGPKGV